MKKLGLIGGIGPESTVAYYRKIIHGVQEKAGRENLPRLSIESLSAFTVFNLCRAKQFDQLAEYVLGALRSLAAGGADIAALTGNTPNIVMDRVRPMSPIPVVSAIEATCAEAQRRGVRRVGLLGTVFTMTNTFFKAPFEDRSIQVVVPDDAQIAQIQHKIESELEHGIVTDETRDAFIAIIKDLQTREGIDQVALACTELPLILSDQTSPVPCLDTVEIHVRALIDAVL
ncbi:aspartate/glutamate racemase family protein [Ralstonia pseudosolanacearum]|uniref:aspartate/glutamate racemase family protein n=1 Tax=Ralstonia pseudosolanacearum TaxID=1310165 RepID=UPI002675C181|nr:aspartate/glutamate racemase family protein [Ralstonia pseudosolanacearum]MDO3623876.1 aspartate/glutamate racemase family protein [Ralstonia pseudosolanacearum]